MGKNVVSVIIGIFFLVNISGCALLLAGAAGGAGTALWLSGKLSDEISASYEKTVEAAKKSLVSLDMVIDKETASSRVTQIISNYPDGRQVWIDIRPFSDKSTKIEIRVGVRGDQAASAKILERIKKYL